MTTNKLKITPNFTAAEFSCRCASCGLTVDDMDSELLIMLQYARALAAIPFNLTSAIRCQEHNARVFGSETSSHLTGHAVDIAIPDNYARFTIKKALKAAGFQRIGDSKDGLFIHVDNDPTKAQFVEWLY